MAGKSYIKVGSDNWDRIKKMYIKTGGQTWTAIRKAYVKTSSGWKKVFDTASNRPFISGNDIPEIRLNTFRTNSTYDPSGTANDPVNPVVVAFPVQQMGPPTTTPTVGWPSGTVGNHLWGYDGTWVSGNGTAMTFTYSWLYNLSGNRNDNIEEFNATSSTGRTDMLTNSSTHLGQNDGDYFDKNFITFRVTATNSAGSASAESSQVYIVKQRPSGTINLINTSVDVPETLSASFTYSDQWYNKPDLSNSYIEWFAIDSAGEALTTTNRVAIEYLNSVSVTGTTTKSGTVFYPATIANKIYSVRITLNNSNTQSAVIPISGFVPNSSFTAEDSTSPGSALSVTSLNILDYYSNQGTDNRGYIPVGGLFRIQSNVTGVDGSTTYRIRYRMYNWQNQGYYGMDGTYYGTASSSAWTTRTGSNTSFGPGGTLISNISVSGTTATLLHNEVIDSSLFGATTFGGGQDRWQIEIEVSALKNSIRKYYADITGGIPYYVSRPATLLLTADPANAQVNQTVTLNGTITALGGGSSYPRQYKVSFGDGTDSGWQPAGGYSYGTFNPTFQITKQYSTVGEYYPVLTTIPDYSSTNTYVVASAALSGATSTSVSVSRLDDTRTRAVVSSSGASGPYYQLFWTGLSTAPDPETRYDAASTTSTITEDYSFSNGATIYFYVRSSTQNLGDTTTNGNGTAGTFSTYGPYSGAGSYTFAQPSGSVSVSPLSGTGGVTDFTATASVSSSPPALIFYQWQYFEGGAFGWVAISGATSSTYTPPSNYASIYGPSLRCQITANNGVGNTLVTESSTITVSSAATKLSTPTNVSASDNRSDGIQVSWTNVSNASTYGVWYGGQPSYDYAPDFGGPTNRGGKTITSSPFLDDAVGTGVTRDYYVQAFPATGSTTYLKSDWSAGDFGTRVSGATIPGAPNNVYASGISSSGATINWSSPSTDGGSSIIRYELNRDGGGFFSVGNVFSYNYFISVPGTYTIGVRAVNSVGAGSASYVSVTIPAAPVAPSTPTGVTLSGSGFVSWNAASGADYYEILVYTATNSTGSNRLGPATATVFGTSYQLGSAVNYSGFNNYARVQVRSWNYSGQVSTYGAWVPSSTTYT